MQIDSVSINHSIRDISQQYSAYITPVWLMVNSPTQELYVVADNVSVCCYNVSTSRYGLGEEQDSYKTPQGAHLIQQKIGQDCQINEIFRARKATGKCAEIITGTLSSDDDLILTRILWLKGLESGKNHGNGVDSYARYIYIHGTQEEGLIGTPASHGCIRMKNKDVIELYDRVDEGCFVYII